MTLRAKCLDLKVNYENVKFKDNSEPYGVHQQSMEYDPRILNKKNVK